MRHAKDGGVSDRYGGRPVHRRTGDRANHPGCRERETGSDYRPIRFAYNLGNFLRTLALPPEIAHWSLTSLRERLIKIGAKLVLHARSIIFQLAEVAVPRRLWEEMLTAIAGLRSVEHPP